MLIPINKGNIITYRRERRGKDLNLERSKPHSIRLMEVFRRPFMPDKEDDNKTIANAMGRSRQELI